MGDGVVLSPPVGAGAGAGGGVTGAGTGAGGWVAADGEGNGTLNGGVVRGAPGFPGADTGGAIEAAVGGGVTATGAAAGMAGMTSTGGPPLGLVAMGAGGALGCSPN